MKIKSLLTVKTLLIMGSLALLTSCNRAEQTTDTSSIANDDAAAENAFYDMKIASDNAGTEISQTKSLEKGYVDSCVTIQNVNYNKDTKQGILTLDFGSTNCTCKDGKQRRGKIQVEYKGGKEVVGTSVVYTADQYFVNNYGVSGKKTVTYSAPLTWNIKVQDGIVTKPDGTKVSWESDRVRKMIAGQTTLTDYTDDTYEITGTSNGVNAEGNKYAFSTETALVKSMGCQYIKAGKLKIERDGKKDAVVDYGDGTCDDKATVKIGNRSKDITLRKW
ncbi:MAG: hypothetical protein KA264_03370 [Crocinitomicaceae bacterium]|jgi:hypothetical protein|nr:hypothetical protein [Crocinitomicaceae bacterium]